MYIQNSSNNRDFYSTLATMGHNAHQQRCCNMLFCLFKALRPEFKEYKQQGLKNAKTMCKAFTKIKSQLILVHRCENSRYVYISPAEALQVGLPHAASVTMKKVNPRLLSCGCCPLNTPSTPIPTHSSQPNYLPCMVTCIISLAWSLPPPPPPQPNYLPCRVTCNNS